jgi:MOSC domain-containing protein YiiM
VKRFTRHGATGAYLRVLETGEVAAGDPVEVLSRPAHGVTAGLAFRALTTARSRLPELAPALAALPVKDRPAVAAKIERRLAARV